LAGDGVRRAAFLSHADHLGKICVDVGKGERHPLGVADGDAGGAVCFGRQVRPAALETLSTAVEWRPEELVPVIICSPTDTHVDYVEAAAKAGKAILCEKPVSLSAERIATCLERIEPTGAPLMVGFNRRFDPSFALLERHLREGRIGSVESITITSRDPAPPTVDYIRRSGGLFRDMMIHDFDLARFLLREEPIEVYAVQDGAANSTRWVIPPSR
jgi:myo-inositol 2-dehydrogenase / D-chiro-inositol 1-dehydrogenase